MWNVRSPSVAWRAFLTGWYGLAVAELPAASKVVWRAGLRDAPEGELGTDPQKEQRLARNLDKSAVPNTTMLHLPTPPRIWDADDLGEF
jgi:hypothetical protein